MDYLVFNLSAPQLHSLAEAALLSAEERAQAEKRGSMYVLTRCLLRRELARRLGCGAQELRFRTNEHGKPECVGSAIHFNISHSGDCLAIAFDGAPIGIDVEQERTRPRLEALASRIMCAEQLAAFRQRGCQQAEFYGCWCAAEALVKQAGSTVWRATEHPFCYEQGRILLPPGSPLSVHSFTPMPGYHGAVARITPHYRNI